MYPHREQALALIDWAWNSYPDAIWKGHSIHVAHAAQTIARAAGLNPDKAFALGALHDIGRYIGPGNARHILSGYHLMLEKGYDEVARVCLTHSFPEKNLDNFTGWDISPDEKQWLDTYICAARMDEYDRLIQLCDSLVVADGVCLMEKRLMHIALRHGVHPGTADRWRALAEIHAEFDRRVGGSIYALFPNAAEMTFDLRGQSAPTHSAKANVQGECPTEARALALLEWAHALNPGPWREHSLNTARAAKAIAAAVGMDEKRAYALGALHDIGRYVGVCHARHVVEGAKLMRESGYEAVARVCLTHSFPDRTLDNFVGWDISGDEKRELADYIHTHEPDEYERLIQLCDALALAEGICLMEKRLVDVALRYGVFPTMVEKWRAFMRLKDEFDGRIGGSIYSLFPDAAKVTFGTE